jgi:hypothetical protein
MAVHLTLEYKAQLIIDLTPEGDDLPKVEKNKISDDFDAFVKKHLADEFYKGVEIDSQYARYALDIGLVSNSKDKLRDACYDIANYTQGEPHLKDIFFECFEN